MMTFVLVGGAWLGGWAYEPVTRRLRARGHDVHPATLTGLGDRVHLGGPQVDLSTHITDVVNLLAYADLSEVVLVGHSYAGAVVAGVADRVGVRLSAVVYLDTLPLEDGERLVDLGGPEAAAALEAQVVDGWRWPMPPLEEIGASLTGLGEAERALLQGRAEAHPFATYREPLRLRGGGPAVPPVVIACEEVQGLVATGIPRFTALTQPPWRYLELPTGHWPMLSAPEELAALLDGLGGAG